MNAFVVPAILSMTVVTAVGLGILGGYTAIMGILSAFAHQSGHRQALAPIFVPSEIHAGGD